MRVVARHVLRSKNGGLLLLLLSLILFLHLFGWLPHNRAWEHTTGWNKIPEKLKPEISTRLFSNIPSRNINIHWLGHSGYIIQWNDLTLLLDPNQNNRCSISRRFLEASAPLPDIDLALISHAHYDHMDFKTLQTIPQLQHLVIPVGDEVYFKNRPFPNTQFHTLNHWEKVNIKELTITATPAKHNGCRHHPWSSKYIALGYILSDGTNTLYFAGDTAYQPEVNKKIKAFNPDTAILPIGAFRPRVPLKIHHMSPHEAVQAAQDLNVSLTIPCHFGTFRLSLDPPSQALPLFAKEARNLLWYMPTFLHTL